MKPKGKQCQLTYANTSCITTDPSWLETSSRYLSLCMLVGLYATFCGKIILMITWFGISNFKIQINSRIKSHDTDFTDLRPRFKNISKHINHDDLRQAEVRNQLLRPCKSFAIHFNYQVSPPSIF